ncbi:MAG: peroxiredoxin family protein [Vulcanimicrobiota bacterium]
MKIKERLKDKLKQITHELEEKMEPENRKKMNREFERMGKKHSDAGLEIGDKAPDFTLKDTSGNDVNLYELLEEGPVVLNFYRAIWCPHCGAELKSLQEHLPEIEEEGATLVAVSIQSPEYSQKTKSRYNLKFPVLSDTDTSVSKKYDVHYEFSEELKEVYGDILDIDVPNYNASGKWELAIPGTYIIDTSGKIVNRFVKFDHTRRMSPEDIIKTLKKLNE